MIKQKENESKSGEISKATVSCLSFSLRVVVGLSQLAPKYCDPIFSHIRATYKII